MSQPVGVGVKLAVGQSARRQRPGQRRPGLRPTWASNSAGNVVWGDIASVSFHSRRNSAAFAQRAATLTRQIGAGDQHDSLQQPHQRAAIAGRRVAALEEIGAVLDQRPEATAVPSPARRSPRLKSEVNVAAFVRDRLRPYADDAGQVETRRRRCSRRPA